MNESVKLGTENIEKVADAIKELVIVGKKVAADKKVNLEDLPVVIGLATKLPKLAEAFQALGEALDEGKDLDVAEVVALIQAVHNKVKEVEKA